MQDIIICDITDEIKRISEELGTSVISLCDRKDICLCITEKKIRSKYKGYFHDYRKTELAQAHAKLLSANKKIIILPTGPLIEPKSRTLENLIHSIKLINKFNVLTFVVSGAKSSTDLRAKKELQSIAKIFGLKPSVLVNSL